MKTIVGLLCVLAGAIATVAGWAVFSIDDIFHAPWLGALMGVVGGISIIFGLALLLI